MSETNPAQACMDTPYPECPPGTNRFEWILHVQAPLVRAAREAAGLTQTAAAEMIFGARRTWADWEGGARKMPPAAWVMFLLRADLHPSAKLVPRVDMFDSASLLTMRHK